MLLNFITSFFARSLKFENHVTCVESTLVHIDVQVGAASNMYNFKMICLIYNFIVAKQPPTSH
jgi:hypothetical protein